MQGGTKISIKLTLAQHDLARDVIAAHVSISDCTLRGLTLEFPDHESAQAFRNKVFGLGSGSTRAYVSMNAIVDKLDAAILRAMKP